MASDEASPGGSKPSSRSSSPSEVLPEALAFGREKRATAGNKLRALLDAEFQEEEIFKEDENDQEFERQKSDEEEVYLSESSESDSDEDAEDDEEAGEKQLLAQQKAEATQARKRKLDKSFVKPPVAKRRIPTKPETTTTTGILASKPTSTTSSVSNRRISFDPTLLVSRRSSRALTVQTTNETQSRIISAAARRATLPVIPRREQTPPLTQEERLAQAVLTEEENKKSLKRIVEAEEERAKKRREKLEALRRRRFDESVIRFISRRRGLIEEIPAPSDDDEKEDENVIIVDGKQESVGAPEVKTEEVDPMVVDEKDAENNTNGPNGEEKNAESEKMNIDQQPEENSAKDSVVESAPENTDVKASPPQIQRESEPPEDVVSPTSVHSSSEAERMNVDDDTVATKDAIMEKTSQDVVIASSPHTPSATNERKSMQGENEDDGVEQSLITKDDSKLTETNTSTEPPQPIATTNEPTAEPVISPSKSASPFQPLQPKTPPPYHEAYFTSNTVSILPLPSQPLQSTRDTFFPSIPLLPPPKPKPCARCPITGLPARYKDPLSGVGYYDIHAFKILREVGRKGGRYVWCSEGGWFVGELGWGGRGAKGVPEGWTA